MEIKCLHCRQPIPEGRLKVLPNTKTCVSCSTTRMKRSITITAGEGEDTYNDIIIVEADQYDRINPHKSSLSSAGTDKRE